MAKGEAQVLEEGWKTDAEIIAAARRKYQLADDLEKEVAARNKRTKEIRSRADGARSEAEQLVRNPPQLELGLSTGGAPEKIQTAQEVLAELDAAAAKDEADRALKSQQ